MLNGLVIGPLDKNNGECSALCPVLYKKVLDKLYPCDGEDYEQVFPKRLTSYRRKRYRDEIMTQVLNTNPKMPKNQKGGEKDIINAWKMIYKAKKWDKYARFEAKGRLGRPYALLKAKNVTDPAVRAEKYTKARPIAPIVGKLRVTGKQEL